jgi:hypothetical protein
MKSFARLLVLIRACDRLPRELLRWKGMMMLSRAASRKPQAASRKPQAASRN